jgi:apocytochrome f
LSKEGQAIIADQPLTNNLTLVVWTKDVVVLQNPVRVQGLLAFFACILLAQILLVVKKTIRKVQLAEMNF